jgi:putative membrane protein
MQWLLKMVIRIILIGLTVYIAANYIDGIEVDSAGDAILMAIVLGVLNTLIRPILVFLTLPISVVTLGLFIFVINTVLFWVAGGLVNGIEINSMLAAFLGALLVSLVTWILNLFLD